MAFKEYLIQDLAEILNGELIRGTTNQTRIRDILIDSRRLISPSRTIFFALSSKRNNGHKYISELYKKGLRHFVVSQLPNRIDQFAQANFIRVENTLEALQALSIAHRNRFDIPVIGITGSNGKTIVKEWLFQLLNDSISVIRSPKSYNSQIGVPLSVWQMDKGHELGIFEAGISEPEEMEKLQQIIQPKVGIFTNIGNAHDENFINHQQKAGEKLKLFTKLDTLVYCADHPEIQGVIIRSGILERVKPFTWSRKQDADLLVSETSVEGTQTCIKAVFKGTDIKICIPFLDDASIENAIHCWATLLHLGYDQSLIEERMLRLSPIAMRLELKEGINNCSVINDSYNSDFNSLSIALDFLSQQKQHQQKTLILSDILQSG
ncbi:MAG: bifunctional UDP-N-acetylmuramoyl-tripeptide:D-alanyl-D-alanine ligase/alanine racemase, partial [Bacteroidetes bacterium]|nr:bifunctional UDP-N-acetylmuramoyl-tripeptide:D-alanyl-D-alanine ligase/alanine racemase [Bacteroidota bacterium]